MSEVKKTLSPPHIHGISSSPRFLRLRSIALGLILFLAFIWIILICIVIYGQWDVLDHVQRSLILIMLFINTITVIIIPILLIQPFRAWLDGARVLFLVLMHGGIALFFAIKSPTFHCFSPTADLNEEAICASIIVFVNVLDWIIPLLVVVYASGLILFVRNQSKRKFDASPTSVDVEKQIHHTRESIQSHQNLKPNEETVVYAYAM